MMKIAVLVSGGGTNLQAILDAIDSGKITNTQVSVVISNNANAYALERAKKHGIPAQCVSPKRYESRELFNRALLETIQSYHVDLVVLAGCLVVIPEMMVKAYPNRIINIHPSLIPAFCGTGYYLCFLRRLLQHQRFCINPFQMFSAQNQIFDFIIPHRKLRLFAYKTGRT